MKKLRVFGCKRGIRWDFGFGLENFSNLDYKQKYKVKVGLRMGVNRI